MGQADTAQANLYEFMKSRARSSCRESHRSRQKAALRCAQYPRARFEISCFRPCRPDRLKSCHESMFFCSCRFFHRRGDGKRKTLGGHSCQAMNHVHKHGYFHRDMKPENLLVAASALSACERSGLSQNGDSIGAVLGGFLSLSKKVPPIAMKPDSLKGPLSGSM